MSTSKNGRRDYSLSKKSEDENKSKSIDRAVTIVVALLAGAFGSIITPLTQSILSGSESDRVFNRDNDKKENDFRITTFGELNANLSHYASSRAIYQKYIAALSQTEVGNAPHVKPLWDIWEKSTKDLSDSLSKIESHKSIFGERVIDLVSDFRKWHGCVSKHDGEKDAKDWVEPEKVAVWREEFTKATQEAEHVKNGSSPYRGCSFDPANRCECSR